jgi:hypothetical protein
MSHLPMLTASVSFAKVVCKAISCLTTDLRSILASMASHSVCSLGHSQMLQRSLHRFVGQRTLPVLVLSVARF